MSTIVVDPSGTATLALVVEDGDASLFPRARVINAAGTVIATVDLVHVTNGTYQAAYVVPASAQQLTVNYTLYTEFTHTTLDPNRGRDEDYIIIASLTTLQASVDTLPFDIWSLSETTSFPTDSMGFMLKLLKGSMGKANLRIDKMVYDSNGFMTGAKMRVFPTTALASASTSRASGDPSLEGAIVEIDLSGVADGTYLTLPSTMVGVVSTP